jgi:hypothetical protein
MAVAFALASASPYAAGVHHKPFRLRRPSAAPTACATNASRSFVGIPGVANVAGGDESAVLSGNSNQACGPSSALGAGQDNVVDVDSQGSFLAGGYTNRIGASGNDSNPSFSFIGAGAFNEVTGPGDFIGGGGTAFGSGLPTTSIVYGNRISGTDSFVGGGDLNDVPGNGSFIGAGGYSYAEGGATSGGNSITGSDSFIGAGDQNGVVANEAFVGAGSTNVITNGADYSFIGAGDNNSDGNQFDVIAGGQSNGVNAIYGSIGGGSANSVSLLNGSTMEANGASFSAIAGGSQNIIQATSSGGAQYAFIGGGSNNTVTGGYATIAGGHDNSASGYMATVPGGYHNLASGAFSFAGGFDAYATTSGSFVWGDYNGKSPRLAPARAGEFLARATGGVTFYTNAAQTTGATLPPGSGTWSSASDRNLKDAVATIDDGAILAKVAALPVAEWTYVSEPGVRHLGPMAQDFRAAFGVGEDDRHIASLDEDGVALAAIKGLNAKLERRDAELAALRRELRALESAVAASRHASTPARTSPDRRR